jgi:hypothetical protein
MSKKALVYVLVMLLGSTAFSATFECLIEVERVAANANGFRELAQEVCQRSFQALLINKHGFSGIEEFHLSCRLTGGELIPQLRINASVESSVSFDALCADVKNYVALRRSGHSPGYAIAFTAASRAQGLKGKPGGDWLSEKGILAGWVKRSERSLAFSVPAVSAPVTTMMRIIDGELAWIWFLSENETELHEPLTIYRIDSSEFILSKRVVFKAASEIALSRINRGSDTTSDYPESMYRVYLKENLKERGIKWRNLEQLNPDMTFD